MSCNKEDKIKLSCPPNLYANCVHSEITIPTFSTLTTQCQSVDEILADTYTLIGNIKDDINVSALINGCITFTTPKTASSVISQLYTKICTLEDTVIAQAALIADLTARIVIIEASPCV